MVREAFQEEWEQVGWSEHTDLVDYWGAFSTQTQSLVDIM